jgi:branched-chain amino acid transport system substrate-binding protein
MANMKKKKENQGISRRDFIKGTAAIGAAAVVGSIGFPNVLRGAAPPEILIGHIHPLSGFLAFDGQEQKKGLMLAVKEINDAGGIKSLGGAKLKVIDADSEGKADRAISEVERLYNAGAVIITGAYQSSVTLVATQVAEKFRVPFIVDVAVADEITARGFKYTFRVQPSSDQLAHQTVKYISEIAEAVGEKVKTIAYLHDNTAFGTSLFNGVIKYAPKYDLEVIRHVPYSPRAADVSTEVGKIKSAGADLIFDTGYFGDGVRVLKTIKNLRVKSKGIIGCGNGAFSHPKFVKELGTMTEYVMDDNLHANPRSPLAQKAFAHFKEVYGTNMSSTTTFSYQAIHVVGDALERAKSTDREAVREALAKTNLTKHVLAQGPIAFGPNGQNLECAGAMMQILGQQIKVVWPEQYAEAKLVFPHPA